MRLRAHAASGSTQQLLLPACAQPATALCEAEASRQMSPLASPAAQLRLVSPQFLAVARDAAEPQARGSEVAKAPEACDWSDEAVAQLHEGLLHHALALLRTRGNLEEKQEILHWIWAPSVFCWVSRYRAGVHQRIPIHRRKLPFTFERCCAVAGLRPEKVRSGLAAALRELGPASGIAFDALGIDLDS